MKKFTVITKDGSKWLQPINVPYPNADEYKDGNEPHPIFARADAIIYEERTRPVPYIGSRPDGTTVDESEVTAIARHKEYTGSDWFNVYDNGNWDYHETRTVYIDAESHNRNISEDYWRKRCEAAEKLIGISPSDPKTYDEFCRLREEWKQKVKQEQNEK